jgi:paraquat-inducible protein A
MTIGCPECGALADIPPLKGRLLARCRVCRYTLERRSGRSISAALACAMTTFVLLIPGNLAPLLTVHLLQSERTSVLGSGIVLMWREGWVIQAALLGTFGVVLPLVRFGGLTIVLTAVLTGWRFRLLGAWFRWLCWIDLWAMPDVFLVGCFIGYARVAQNLGATIGAGGYCFIAAAMLTMITRSTLEPRTVWRAILADRRVQPGERVIACRSCDLIAHVCDEGRPCPRCGLTLWRRKPHAVLYASALTLAALVLTVPANLYPMTISVQLGSDVEHRIIDGVADLFRYGLWPLGILIFVTSILIPFAKLAGMAWFVFSVRRRSRRLLREKTLLYRLIDELGRWSFVDVFTIAAFVPLIRFGGLASAYPAPGASAFALVVVLTMAASRAFDPRLLWDAQEGRGR